MQRADTQSLESAGDGRGEAGAGLCGAQGTRMGGTTLEANTWTGSDQAGFIRRGQI